MRYPNVDKNIPLRERRKIYHQRLIKLNRQIISSRELYESDRKLNYVRLGKAYESKS